MALVLAYRSHKGQNMAFQGSAAPMLNRYHSGECCGAGRLRSSGSGVGSTVSGRTGKTGRTRKAYYTRIPCYINSARVLVYINCAGATAAVWIQCTNTFPRRATSVLSGTVVKQARG